MNFLTKDVPSEHLICSRVKSWRNRSVRNVL